MVRTRIFSLITRDKEVLFGGQELGFEAFDFLYFNGHDFSVMCLSNWLKAME